MRIKIFFQSVLLILSSWYACYVIFCGQTGLTQQKIIQQEIATESSRVQDIQEKIAAIKNKIALAQEDHFMLEKIAREDLHMSCTNEYVYLLKTEV